jgi:sulfite exporter TauE/SafE/copper chaperone CopZ
MSSKNQQLKIEGMQCVGCEETIVEAVNALPGIQAVKASYVAQSVDVEYDDTVVDLDRITTAITGKGYAVTHQSKPKAMIKLRRFVMFIMLLALVGGAAFWGKNQMPAVMQMMQPHMDQMLLLSIGFLTGFHCIGMCGALVVGYANPNSAKWRQLLAHLSYGFGNTLSYETLGAGFGFLGASIAITQQMRGIAGLAASIFLLIYGLKMLNVFSVLRRFALRLPKEANRQIAGQMRKHRSALATGLLSGLLLGCGPLQAMYVMAAGSGDPLQGAEILALFGLGTLVPLLGFGVFASLIPQAGMRQLVRVSGVLVIVMGVMMFQRGMMLLKGGQLPAMSPHSMQMSH